MILISKLWAIYNFLYLTAPSFINIVIEEDYVFLESCFFKCFILERILFDLGMSFSLLDISMYTRMSFYFSPSFKILEWVNALLSKDSAG